MASGDGHDPENGGGELKEEYQALQDNYGTPPRRDSLQSDDSHPYYRTKNGRKGLCRGPCTPLDIAGTILAILALLSLLAALILPQIIHQKIKEGIDQETILESPTSKHFNAETYEVFRTAGESKGVHIYFATRWFNVTNPDEVLGGARPVLEEVGPYIYREHRRKLNMMFSDDGDTVSFILYRYYVWDEEASEAENARLPRRHDKARGKGRKPVDPNGGGEDGRQKPADVVDQIITMSPITQVLMAQLQETMASLTPSPQRQMWSYLLGDEEAGLTAASDHDSLWKMPLKLILCEANRGMIPTKRVHPFVTRSPRDLFFGYCPDPLMLALQRLVNTSASIAQKLNQNISLPPVPRAFPGLYVNLSSESDAYRRTGSYRVHTGKVNRDLLQSTVLFLNMSVVHACPNPATGPKWNDKECEMPSCYVYNGDWDSKTAAEHGYTPQWGTDDANRVVGSDGSMFQHPMDKDEVVTWQDDYRRNVILRFEKEHSDWRDIRLRKYILREEDFENCTMVPDNCKWYQYETPRGITNVSHTGGFPLYMSKPHFLEADPWVSNSVSGLFPTYNKHETLMDVEPMTGVTMRAHKRIQLNIQVKPTSFPGRRLAFSDDEQDLGLSPGVRACMADSATWDFSDPIGQGLYFPLMWYDEYFEQPTTISDDITKIHSAKAASQEVRLWGYVCLAAFVIGAIACFGVARRREAIDNRRRMSLVDEPLLGQ